MRNRFDETWHRLREWTKGQSPSERLAAQILINEDFLDLDPSHPLGGKDGGKDAIAIRDGKRFAMAVYFPRGQKSLTNIKTKFEADLVTARRNSIHGIAFVTNQELRLVERKELRDLAPDIIVELYHLERITAILDSPPMSNVREQFLDIAAESESMITLGGGGGLGPGAGGAGGGAIGPGSRGGRGGEGGKIYNFGITSVPPETLEELLRQARDAAVTPPGGGGGGGGAGATGENVVAGDGGGGGEGVIAAILVEPGDRLEVEVGEGGTGAFLPGQHGRDGGDTVVLIRGADGTLKATIRAKGGTGAKAGKLPEGVIEISQADLEGGLQISTLMLLNVAEVREGLLYILGGGWGSYSVLELPTNVVWPFVCTISWRILDASAIRGFCLCVLDPNGIEISRSVLQLPAQPTDNFYMNWLGHLNVPLNSEGRWLIRVQSGGFTLSQIQVNVVLAPKS